MIYTIGVLALSLLAGAGAWAATATGVVYHDKNGDGVFNKGDKPLRGIKVSNGRAIVKTDKKGRYSLEVDGATVLFVLKPSGWRTPLSQDNLPLFYYIHHPEGSPALDYAGVAPTGPLPESVDFALYRQKEPKKFRALLFADPQPRDQREIDYIAHDVVEQLVGTDAAFGVTLGDILFDDLSLFGSINRTIGLIGIPWYNVVGNHDINFDAAGDFDSNATFTRVYGPPYYSFDYGEAHFVVLDNVEWHGATAEKKGFYRGALDEDQLEFLRNDLALVDEDRLLVLFMHVPLNDVDNRQELYRLIEERPFTLSFSGHTHYQEHRFIGAGDGWRGPEPHHHVVTVAVSGSWWSGAPDERGIPHTLMRDGAPNGYGLVSFDGRDYTFDFRAASEPADYQMNIHAPEVVGIDTAGRATVRVNVFSGSERSTVEMRLGGGEWRRLERRPQRDPYFLAAQAREKASDAVERPLPFSGKSSHIWQGNLPAPPPAGTHLLRVRSRDMFGRVFEAARVIRVE